MSELLAQAVDICRKLIGEKTTPEINEIEAAITNITYNSHKYLLFSCYGLNF